MVDRTVDVTQSISVGDGEESGSGEGSETQAALPDGSFTSNSGTLGVSPIKAKKTGAPLLEPKEDPTLDDDASINMSPPPPPGGAVLRASSTRSFPTFSYPTSRRASQTTSQLGDTDDEVEPWEDSFTELPVMKNFGVRISRKSMSRTSKRISSVVKSSFNKKKMGKEDAKIARNVIAIFFSVLNLISYLLVKGKDDDYESPLGINVHTTLVVSCAMAIGASRLSDTSTYGERVLLALVCGVLWIVSTTMMFFYTSPCIHCMYFSTTNAVESSKYSMIEPQRGGVWKFWHLLLGSDGQYLDDESTLACRSCVSNMVAIFYGGWNSYLKRRIGIMPSHKSKVIEEMEVKEEFVQDDTGDLAAWYLDFANKTRAQDLKSFNGKLASALEEYGYLAGDDLADAFQEYLCSPASRIDNPDPAKYLADIKTGRFTGETDSTNLTTAALQRIMRGDVLDELGVAVCFMLRFALFIPENHDLEITPISHTDILPPTNEDGYKAFDIRPEFPGIVLPQLDQDIDPTGDEMLRFRKIMGVFTKLPFEKKTLYFDTQAEYLAFFRWELEGAIQDAWYFPRWLLGGPKEEALANLVAEKMKNAQDQLVLEDPNSDKTMSDRLFWGAGQYYLTPIRIPGIDVDHDFFYPHKSKHFMSDDHRDKFRFRNRPTHEQLLGMIKQFYPRKVTPKSNLLWWRDKILQVDFSPLEILTPREHFFPFGATLYVDAQSRMPMGIWIAGRKRLFLPNEGRDWDHAKYFWRVCERGAVTGRHVGENHFGYSHSGATAAWQTLDADHGIRLLLKPFTIGAHSVNSAAYNMLIRDHSVLTHGASLENSALATSFNVIYAQLNYSETIPDMLDSHDIDHILDTSKLPLWSQGKRLYDAHRKFVGNY
ncbi:MAG: hypothetical protein SGILL_007501, partial [Bacillariaceae sp.]